MLAKFADYFGELRRQGAGRRAHPLRRRGGDHPHADGAASEFEITSQWIPVEIKRALAGMPGMSSWAKRGAGYFIMPMNTQRCRRPTTSTSAAPSPRRSTTTALMSLMQVTPDKPGAIPMHGAIPSGLLGYDKTLRRRTSATSPARKAELAKSKYAAQTRRRSS